MDTAQQEISALERLVGPQGASPLFARLADVYLSAGRPKDALRVCDAGLAHFPFYSTGHFVKGRALIALDMTNEARRELEFVRDWLPANPTIWSYLDSLPISEDQLLTPEAEAEPVAAAAIEAPESQPNVASPIATEQPGGFFSAITESEAPTAAADTSAPLAAPAEENVFGLPSEAPQDAGGFGGGTAEEAPQAFSGFGGFGEPTETAAQEEFSQPAVEEPVASFEETVTSAMSGEASGFGSTAAPEISDSTFDGYADRMRLELGPTGIITLEQFLEGDGTVPPDAPAGFGSFDGGTAAETPQVPVMTAEPVTESFGLDSFPSTETSSEPTPAATEEAISDFSGPDFSGLTAVEETPSALPAEEVPATDDGGFAGPAFEGPPADTTIEGLTEKLQNAKKITPVIDFSTKTSTESGENPMVSSGFVTPTLAEIYAKQGWFDDAIKAYRALAKTKPAERDKFEARIAELEEEKKKQE